MTGPDIGGDLVVALAGNPNSGKTTVFNEMTGARRHVGNWPGVTVERHEGWLRKDGVNLRIIDLPGIYSLSTRSQEETIARNFLTSVPVDVIVNVVDAGNLERNLYLTTQLLELGIPTVVALNMVDVAQSAGVKIDVGKFSELLGVPVVPTVGHRGEGIDELLTAAIARARCETCEPPRSARHSPEIEMEIERLRQALFLNDEGPVSPRWLLVKSLEGDGAAIAQLVERSPLGEAARLQVDISRHHLEQHFGDDLAAVITDGRYGFIGGLIREAVVRTGDVGRVSLTEKIDAVLLNRVLGIPILLALMWITFKLTFDLGGVFGGYIDRGFVWLGSWLAAALPPGVVSSLLVNGVIAGVGGVLVFLPNIVVIFIIISFLEGSGYMARAAFLMDKFMHIVGLHGKSCIPMLMGFGCNVPAIMATRTLETREDRLLTMLIIPFMSCSARLPIYILFAGALFPNHAALVIFCIYALGIVLGAVSGKLLKRTLFGESVSPFVMELPPYRWPTIKGTFIYVWERSYLFLSKAGTVVLAASVGIWLLGALPWGAKFGGEESLVGKMGWIAGPVMRPLGLDWRAGIALFFGFGAKEIVVSTLGVLYGSQDNSVSLQEVLPLYFTPLAALTFMAFSLVYTPCVATVAAIRREANSNKWMLFSVAYSMALAYIVALCVRGIGLAFGLR